MSAPHFRGENDGRVFYHDGSQEREIAARSGFRWWENGAEAIDLALAILKTTTGAVTSSRHAPTYAREVIRDLPPDGFQLDLAAVRAWIQGRR